MSGGNEENHQETCQDIWSLDLYLNQEPPEYEAEVALMFSANE